MSVVEFMFSSFPLLFFEPWSVIESDVDARPFFGRLRAATTAAAPKITLRPDKRLNPSSESGNILDSASFVCVGMFIAISSVAPGPALADAFLALLKATNTTRTSVGSISAEAAVN